MGALAVKNKTMKYEISYDFLNVHSTIEVTGFDELLFILNELDEKEEVLKHTITINTVKQ